MLFVKVFYFITQHGEQFVNHVTSSPHKPTESLGGAELELLVEEGPEKKSSSLDKKNSGGINSDLSKYPTPAPILHRPSELSTR
jgi:hypothetical protein